MEVTGIISIDISTLMNGVIAFLFAALMAFATTPIVRVLAYKIGAVDVPKDDRRMHKVPKPRLGGLAIFFSFVLTLLFFYDKSDAILAMILGSFIIVVVGIIDDAVRLRAVIKFVAQIAAALVVVGNGVVIERINLFGDYIEFGYLSIPITVLWIVGLTNAVNLIDGLDGLACGISTISAIALLIVTILMGDFKVALLVAILAGSCIGFLPYNLNPAKIFVGDTGAMFLGFILAVISIQGVFKTHAVLTFVIPFLILGVPIFDTAFAIIRRLLTGKHPFEPDRGHLHHRLIDMGFNQKQTVRILYAISALLGIAAIMLTSDKLWHAVIMMAISLGISVVTWIIVKNDETRAQSGLADDGTEFVSIEPRGDGEAAEESAESEEPAVKDKAVINRK